MLYKHKGSKNDPSKYRCIGLLNHCYKILSQCLLQRLSAETDGYLADWQAGFRKLRGCRDNVMLLRTLIEDVLEQGDQVVATFVDYSAAFDSVSHKFLDIALADTGASAKSRAIFRSIYSVASATARDRRRTGAIKTIPDPSRSSPRGYNIPPLFCPGATINSQTSRQRKWERSALRGRYNSHSRICR